MRRAVRGYALAIVSLSAATFARWLLDSALGNQLVFSLYFAVVAISAWYGGIGPALVALVGGWLLGDWLFLDPRGSFEVPDLDALLACLTYAVAGLAIVVCMEAIRRSRQKPVTIAAEPSELHAVAEAVRQHQINSRELVAYLEGLNASPASFVAAAKYEDFDLAPDELASRLEALVCEAEQATLI